MTQSFAHFGALMLTLGCAFHAIAQESNAPATARRGGRGGISTGSIIAGQMLSQGDRDKDQRITKNELGELANAWFDRLDSGQAGRINQEEFISRFGTLLPERPGFGQGGGQISFGPSPYLGVFVAIDADSDSSLTRVELKEAFEKWFDQWDSEKGGAIDLQKLTAGLDSAWPRTNMGRGVARESQTRIPGLPDPPPSPALAPDEALTTLHVQDGFRIELMASEPTIEDPIALAFDADGRLYVLEMRSFMLDINRSGERDPIGRITLLEDTDRDGRFDKSTVFADHLMIPRSISAYEGGVLYVSDYKLYFAKDINGDGRADQNALVDPDYGRGNVEHAPNGLMRALDNWIYNARSQYRYRWMGNVLVKQRTENRGQWGITQDNYGRLLYNVNNSQLLGDYAPPNYMGRNPHHPSTAGLNLFVATDQRVFTLRMNTAVNRGYLTEVLDNSGKLYVFPSSCSPVIYRGDNYPAEFIGNAFVCDPAGNLIKRNVVFDDNLSLASRFAYDDSEFLASTDERFRPVNLFNAPDGTLWVVDMYRGIIQYSAFMTPYLRRETLERGLDQGIHLGRVYRIVSKVKSPTESPRLSQESSAALVKKLLHPNGWVRDTAQRLLVERGDPSTIPALVKLVATALDPLARIHALWTLEGLLITRFDETNPQPEPIGGSTNSVRLITMDEPSQVFAPSLDSNVLDACLNAIKDSDPKVQTAAIRVSEALAARNPACREAFLRQLALGKEASAEVAFQMALSAGNLSKPSSLPVLTAIAAQHAGHSLIRHAILSGLENWELQFLQILLSDPHWDTPAPGRGALLQALAKAVIVENEPRKAEMLLVLAAGQKNEQSWRRSSLLEGMASHSQNRRFRPIALGTSPKSLEILAASDDPRIQELNGQVRKLFSWPGHQDETAVATSTAARPVTPDEGSAIAAGRLLFEYVCSACHGLTGEGIRPLAPPLANSNWVLGSENRLIRIALDGVSGPIHVDGTRYEPPLTLPDMPALREALDDSQIASVLSYIRHEWGEGAGTVSPEKIGAVRNETQSREIPWTEEELLKIE